MNFITSLHLHDTTGREGAYSDSHQQPAKPHRPLDEKTTTREARSAEGRGGAMASARTSQPTQPGSDAQRNGGFYRFRRAVPSFHAGCGLASLSERLPLLLLLACCASRLRFSSLRPLSKVSSPSAISPKADLQGGVGNFVWSSTSITKSHHGTETRPKPRDKSLDI